MWQRPNGKRLGEQLMIGEKPRGQKNMDLIILYVL